MFFAPIDTRSILFPRFGIISPSELSGEGISVSKVVDVFAGANIEGKIDETLPDRINRSLSVPSNRMDRDKWLSCAPTKSRKSQRNCGPSEKKKDSQGSRR